MTCGLSITQRQNALVAIGILVSGRAALRAATGRPRCRCNGRLGLGFRDGHLARTARPDRRSFSLVRRSGSLDLLDGSLLGGAAPGSGTGRAGPLGGGRRLSLVLDIVGRLACRLAQRCRQEGRQDTLSIRPAITRLGLVVTSRSTEALPAITTFRAFRPFSTLGSTLLTFTALGSTFLALTPIRGTLLALAAIRPIIAFGPRLAVVAFRLAIIALWTVVAILTLGGRAVGTLHPIVALVAVVTLWTILTVTPILALATILALAAILPCLIRGGRRIGLFVVATTQVGLGGAIVGWLLRTIAKTIVAFAIVALVVETRQGAVGLLELGLRRSDDPVIMFSVLEVVLGRYGIAGSLRIAR